MYPILGRYGSFFLYSYTVVMGLGILAGVGVMAWQARQRPLHGWLDGVLAALVGGLVGGRIGFVLRQWRYFQERPFEIWQIQQGGLSYHGALLAAGLALWVWWRWLRREKRPLGHYLSRLALPLALASVFGWFACWLEGCAYGQQAVLSSPMMRWLAADLPDSYGVFDLRYRTQMLGMLWSGLVLALVWGWRRRVGIGNGRLFWLALLLLSLGRAGIGLLRGDVAPHLGAWRLDMWLDGLLVLLSLILLQYERPFSLTVNGQATTPKQETSEEDL